MEIVRRCGALTKYLSSNPTFCLLVVGVVVVVGESSWWFVGRLLATRGLCNPLFTVILLPLTSYLFLVLALVLSVVRRGQGEEYNTYWYITAIRRVHRPVPVSGQHYYTIILTLY